MPKRIPRQGNQTAIDLQMLKLAEAAALLSEDPKSKIDRNSAVGSVIARNGELLAQSPNIVPPAAKRLLRKMRADSIERYHFIEHAERAAIITAFSQGHDLRQSTIYCTRFPCSDCARAIVMAGIDRLVVSKGYSREKRWVDAQRYAREFLKAAGVRIRYLPRA